MSIIRFSRPDTILLGFLTYCLGAGMANYLAGVSNWPVFFLGLLILLPILAATFLLNRYFRLLAGEKHDEDDPMKAHLRRTHLILVISVLLTISCASVIALLINRALELAAAVSLCFIVLLFTALEIAPLSLKSRGYGELVIAIVLASLFPLFSFLLQFNEFNRILLFVTFPLTLQAISWQIAGNFSTYAEDKKVGQASLVLRLTWQKALDIHHTCLFVSILLFLATPIFGLPWRLIWPIILVLPFMFTQILWLQRIANGGKPLWRFFNILIPSTIGISVYLLNVSFWFR